MLAEGFPPIIDDIVLPVVIEVLGSIPTAVQVYAPFLAVYTHRVAASFHGVITVRVDGGYAIPVSAGLARFYEGVEQSIVGEHLEALFRFSELSPQHEGFEKLRYKWMLELDLALVLDELQRSEKSPLPEVFQDALHSDVFLMLLCTIRYHDNHSRKYKQEPLRSVILHVRHILRPRYHRVRRAR